MATIHPLFKENQSNNMQAAREPAKEHGAVPNMSLQPPILALSNNANLLEIVTRAVPSGSQVLTVNNLDALMAKCRSVRPGVLLMDTACVQDITGTVIQLMQDLPELVVVVAGKSDESSALMKLTASGQIYRFLLTPLAHGQTKLTLEAALTQHLALGAANDRREANASEEGGSTRKSYLPAYIGLGAALIVVVGGAFFGLSRMGGSDQAVVTPAMQNGGASSKELALADAALAADKLLEPPGESALDLYRSALAISPNDARAAAGIEAVAGKLLEKAEAAVTAEQLETAIMLLEQARDVSPKNPRLKFLDSQVARERERLKLTQAQDLGKKVRTLLAEAQNDIDAGRLIGPAGNNARESILEARKLDATDPGIAQAQRLLINRMIESARSAAEQNQAEQAQALLAAARQMGYAGADLSTVERTLNDARTKASSAAEAQAKAAAAKAAAAQAERDAAAAAEKKAAEAAAQVASTAVSAPATTPPVALKRIKTVSPSFPEAAKKAGVGGWVEVTFTVNSSGIVENAHVTAAEPKNTFDWAAVQAIEQWRFEPPLRDGKPTSQVSKVKLRFDSQK